MYLCEVHVAPRSRVVLCVLSVLIRRGDGCAILNQQARHIQVPLQRAEGTVRRESVYVTIHKPVTRELTLRGQ